MQNTQNATASNELQLKPCPICRVPPRIGYACGEYFISGQNPACPICGDAFSEMHTCMHMEIEAWNSWAAENKAPIALTLEQWQTVLHWLQYGADYHHAKMYEWRAVCHDKEMGAAKAAQHEKESKEAADLHKFIEETLYPPPKPETE